MTKVALKYDVSSSFMARVCTWLNIPRPERGYWAKLAVGKAIKRPPLPEAAPGDEFGMESIWAGTASKTAIAEATSGEKNKTSQPQ